MIHPGVNKKDLSKTYALEMVMRLRGLRKTHIHQQSLFQRT